MAGKKKLTSAESEVLEGVVQSAGMPIAGKDIPLLAEALLKCSSEMFCKAMDAICENTNLQNNIIAALHESAAAVIASNDSTAKMQMNMGEANSAAIRTLIKSGKLPPDMLRECFTELRFYYEKNAEQVQKVQQANAEAQEREKAALEAVSKKSSSISTTTVVTSSLTAGACLGVVVGLIIRLTGRK